MSLLNSSHDTVTTLLFSEAVVKRRLPVNLDSRDLDLFHDEIERQLPDVNLLELHNVRITPDGLLWQGGQLLDQSFPFPVLRNEWTKLSVVKATVRSYLPRIRRIKEDVVWVTDIWSGSYFHWLADVLSKLVVLKDLLHDRVLLLPQGYDAFDFVQASLKAFAIDRVEFLRPREVVRCAKLLTTTPIAPSGHYREGVIREVRQRLVDHFGASAATNHDERIYISRQDARKRKIANEPEVIDVLTRFGFKVIKAEGLSFADQVKLASGARHLVSNHGAGLTNMLFMPPDGAVLELRHKSDSINNCYFTLSSALGLEFFYQACAPVSAEDPHLANLLVDISALETNLRLMMDR